MHQVEDAAVDQLIGRVPGQRDARIGAVDHVAANVGQRDAIAAVLDQGTEAGVALADLLFDRLSSSEARCHRADQACADPEALSELLDPDGRRRVGYLHLARQADRATYAPPQR